MLEHLCTQTLVSWFLLEASECEEEARGREVIWGWMLKLTPPYVTLPTLSRGGVRRLKGENSVCWLNVSPGSPSTAPRPWRHESYVQDGAATTDRLANYFQNRWISLSNILRNNRQNSLMVTQRTVASFPDRHQRETGEVCWNYVCAWESVCWWALFPDISW